MVTTLNSINKAEKVLAQCKITCGGCGLLKYQSADGHERWSPVVGEFGKMPHAFCFRCTKKGLKAVDVKFAIEDDKGKLVRRGKLKGMIVGNKLTLRKPLAEGLISFTFEV